MSSPKESIDKVVDDAIDEYNDMIREADDPKDVSMTDPETQEVFYGGEIVYHIDTSVRHRLYHQHGVPVPRSTEQLDAAYNRAMGVL